MSPCRSIGPGGPWLGSLDKNSSHEPACFSYAVGVEGTP
jgi:hypothetical protein